MMRLNKYLARAGVASRRASDELIEAGRVKINGKIVTQLGIQVDEKKDRVDVDGNRVRPGNFYVYIALNKPIGYITTASDDKGRDKVTDLVRVPVRVFPVGRLDSDSEGLILLTNDGNLSYRLLHPRFKVEKRYQLYLDREISAADLVKIRQGLLLEDGWTKPGKAEYLNLTDKKFITIGLYEGRNRQIRRMFSALGYSVRKLKRIAIGAISLGSLKTGEWRYLTDQEIQHLMAQPERKKQEQS